MKKNLIFLLLLAVILGLAACGTGTDNSPNSDSSAENEGETYTVAFETTDINGEAWNEKNFAEYDLVMMCFWEPWCGNCVAEMPDLQKLYLEYADKNVLVVGVVSTEEGMLDTINSNGVTYPNLHYVNEFDALQTGFIPNAVFFDGEGTLVGGPYTGAKSFEDWSEIIEGLL